MNELTKFLIKELLDEPKTVAIYGGGFKPPTKGHFNVVEKTLEDFPEIDELKIFVGGGVRDGITQDESIKIWNIYKNYLSDKVEIEPSVAPVKSVLGYAKENPDTKVYWILGAREDNEDDLKDIAERTKSLGKYPNIEVKIILTSGGVSGTKARQAIKTNNKEQFLHLIPDIDSREQDQIWNILHTMVSEGLVDNVKSKIKDFISAIKQESKETKEAFKLILKAAKGEIELTDDQKKQIGDQLKDVLKTIGLTAIAVLPGGVIVATLLKIFKQSHLVTPSAFVNEGIISLTNNEENSLRELVPIFIQALKNKKFDVALTSPVKYKMSTGEEAEFTPYIYLKNENSSAKFFRQEGKDFKDNWIGINGFYWYPAFEGTLEGIWKKLTGDNPEEALLSSLRHELIHAKDPAVNQKPLKTKYDPSKPELYYGSWIEFPTMTGEFLEAIKFKSYDYINKNIKNLDKAIPELNSYYQDILDFYSGKNKQFEKGTMDWLAGGEKGNLIQKFIRKVADWGGDLLGIMVNPGWDSRNVLNTFYQKIELVRKYNPEGYKEFQKDLYKTIQNTIDNINKQLPKNIPVKLKAGGQGKLVEKGINEVGEANLKPYKWEEVDAEGYYVYTRFITDSETQYDVDIKSTVYFPPGQMDSVPALEIEFTAKPKGAEGSSAKIVVNKGEMYRVMSTIVDIIKKYIKKSKAQAIIYSPSKKSGEDFGTQRDQLYRAFISKAFPGTIFKQSDDFVTAILPNAIKEDTKRIPQKTKSGKKRPASKHSDLYTDEDPKGTITGLGFKDSSTARDGITKINKAKTTHAHKVQATLVMKQRAKAAIERTKDPEKKKKLQDAYKIWSDKLEQLKRKTKSMKKEATDPQAGTALPYGSGFGPVKESYQFKISDKNYDSEDNSLITVEYKFSTPDNTYRVEFYSGEYSPESKTFDVSFGLDKGYSFKLDTFQMTGENNALNILKTIVNIIIDFTNKFEVNKLVINPTSEKRGKVYSMILKSLPSNILNKIELIQETVTATQVICDNCGWEWDKADGGKDLYICHKCGHDNTPKKDDPFGLNELARTFVKEVFEKDWNLKDGMLSLTKYMMDNGMNIKPLPKIKVIDNDAENASNLLGKTAYYNPAEKSITLFTMNRHPKDILRSFAHEMVHHQQNLEDRLNNINTSNTNEDGDLPDIEREAYEKGNMMFRNWEDNIKNV